MGGRDEARDALREGAALVGPAARRAWAPLAVCTLGWAAVFTAGRAQLPADAATSLTWTGLALVLLMTPSKLGALHRLAAGDDTAEAPGPAGLQAGVLEARLSATAVALVAFALLLLAAASLVAAVTLNALRPLGRVDAGPLGTWGVGFLMLSPAWPCAPALILAVVGRLMVTLAAEAVEPAPRFARGWRLTRGAGAAPAVVLGLTVVLPLLGLFLLETGLDALGGLDPLAAGRWSAPEAALVGLLLAGVTQFGLAPLNAGALAHLRRRGRARELAEDGEAAVDTPGALGDKAACAHPAAPSPELLAT